MICDQAAVHKQKQFERLAHRVDVQNSINLTHYQIFEVGRARKTSNVFTGGLHPSGFQDVGSLLSSIFRSSNAEDFSTCLDCSR